MRDKNAIRHVRGVPCATPSDIASESGEGPQQRSSSQSPLRSLHRSVAFYLLTSLALCPVRYLRAGLDLTWAGEAIHLARLERGAGETAFLSALRLMPILLRTVVSDFEPRSLVTDNNMR